VGAAFLLLLLRVCGPLLLFVARLFFVVDRFEVFLAVSHRLN
jgi:hypothetical protein